MRGKIVGGRYFLDGVEVTKEEFDEAIPELPLGDGPGGHSPSCWPMVSEAMAVHPKRVEEAIANARAKGVPTDFDPMGRPILVSRAHRKAYNHAYGVHDNNGGYGD
jgi:hypothetical protein